VAQLFPNPRRRPAIQSDPSLLKVLRQAFRLHSLGDLRFELAIWEKEQGFIDAIEEYEVYVQHAFHHAHSLRHFTVGKRSWSWLTISPLTFCRTSLLLLSGRNRWLGRVRACCRWEAVMASGYVQRNDLNDNDVCMQRETA
jgi:hypothetical protein